MQIAFRTDSSSQIGIGHLVRCLVLADEFKRLGHHCTFICHYFPGHQGAMVEDHGHRLVLLPPIGGPTDSSGIKVYAERDSEETRSALVSQKPNWLVCDHYGIDERWETALRGTAGRILVIDDLADRRHDCDALIDQNLFPDMNERYSDRVGSGTLLMLGPKYALLRGEFAARRRNLDRRFNQPPRLFVGFGGADPANATERVVCALLGAFGDTLEMVVVAGPANSRFDHLHVLWERNTNIRLCRSIKRMADCLAEVDLAIGGGGLRALERCALGLPSLIYAIADNQILPSKTLAGMGAARYMGTIEKLDTDELITTVRRFAADGQARASISRAGMEVVDGAGVDRVITKLSSWFHQNIQMRQDITLRPAELSDADTLLEWRNDPKTRSASKNTGIITREEHLQWLEKTIKNKRRKLLIAEERGIPVGTVRAEYSGDAWEVSWTVSPRVRGRGIGQRMVALLSSQLVDAISAEVKTGNHASARIAEKAGMKLIYEKDGIMFFRREPILNEEGNT